MKRSIFSQQKTSSRRRSASVSRLARIAGLRSSGGITFRRFLAFNLAVAFVGSLLFSGPFCISAEAAGVQITNATFTADSPQATKYQMTSSGIEIDSGSEYRVVTVESFGSYYVNVRWPQQQDILYSVFQGYFAAYLQATAPSVSGWNHRSTAVVIDNITIPGIVQTHSIDPYIYSTGRGYFRAFFEENNAYSTGMPIQCSFRVVSTFISADVNANTGDFALYSPSVAASNPSLMVYGYSPAAMDPYLYDASLGYLPAINNKLEGIQTNTANAYTMLGFIHAVLVAANDMLYPIKNDVNDIRDYLIENTAAADVVTGAAEDFNNEAGSLEAQQAVLEAQADSAFDAVDMDVSLLGTYSQSMSFWMRCVNALPTISGALWDVLVFAFLISFLIFILRLVR